MEQCKYSASELLADYRSQPINIRAHEEWALYRTELTDFILESCEAGTTIAIYGAGGCNDIDLGRLCGHFSEVALIDNDEEELGKIDVEQCFNNIKTVCFDLTGQDESALQRYINYLIDRHNSGRIENGFSDFADGLEELARTICTEDRHPTGIVPVLGKQYDYAVIAGVHSQLNNVLSGLASFCLGRFGVSKELRTEAVERIEAVQRLFTEQIVRTADDIVLDATLRGIVLGFEYEVHSGNDIFTYVEGASHCAADFEQLQKDGLLRLEKSRHLRWDIDSSRCLFYDMLVASFVCL